MELALKEKAFEAELLLSLDLETLRFHQRGDLRPLPLATPSSTKMTDFYSR